MSNKIDDEDYVRRTMLLVVAEITNAASSLVYSLLLASRANRITNLARARTELHASIHRLDLLMAEPLAERDMKVCGPPPEGNKGEG